MAKMYFLKGEDSVMEEAYLACKSQQTDIVLCDILEIREIQRKQIDPNQRIIVVTNRLSDDFNQLKEFENIRIVGPLCVLACLSDGISLPNCKGPLLNIAMKGAIICCSGLPKDKKTDIKERVQMMYGKVTNDFVANTTHLITDSVTTLKYATAAENGINIMTPLWIESIWKESQNHVVRYDNEQFDKYKCPVFYNLRICVTGFAGNFLNNISGLIKKHGGTFSNTMSLSRTDVLICHGDNIQNSSKYKAVISRRGSAENIRCLSAQWIHDSIRRGYSLPDEDYVIHNRSTPNAKVNKENDMDSRMFLISRINDADISTASCSTVDATVTHAVEAKRDLSKTIDSSVLKQASTYLDGCYIYLICITGEDLVFLQRALKYTGATRLDAYSDRVTHVVVGDDKNDMNCQELRTLIERLRNHQAIHIVSMRWLIESINKQTLLAEDTYSVSVETSLQSNQDKNGSPLSKKGLKLLRTDTSIRADDTATTSRNKATDNSTFKAPNELQQYMQSESDTLARYWNECNTEDLAGVDTLQNATAQSIADTIRSAEKRDTTQEYSLKCRNKTPFRSQTFQLLQFESEEMDELTEAISQLGGRVVSRTSGARSYRGVTDYAIVPLISDREATRTVTAEHVLTNIWVRECADKGRSVGVDYYHRCVTEAASNVLDGCVVSTSSYKQWEQTYLYAIIQHMGGHTQGDLSKVKHEERGLLATTHLLTNCTKSNKKYDGAKRWGVPIVISRWAEDCLRAGKRLPEADYPVLAEFADKTFTTPNQSTKKQIDATPGTPLARTKGEMEESFASPQPVTPSCNIARKIMLSNPETPQFQSPALSPQSQVSPVTRRYNEVMERIKYKAEHGLLYDSDCDSPTSTRLLEQRALLATPETPDSPFVTNLLGPTATRAERKELREILSKIPHNTPPPQPQSRRYSTPLSELKRRFVAKCDENYEKECQKLRKEAEDRREALKLAEINKTNDDDVFKNDGDLEMAEVCDPNNVNDPAIVEEKMRNFLDKLATPIQNNKPPRPTIMTPVTGRELPDSQTYSVGYDYVVEDSTAKTVEKERIFLITGCSSSDKEALQNKIENLGAKVAPDQTKFDKITHLLCTFVARNEKTLCSIASGKWVLHVNYIEESIKAGSFLDEELFEFGNPKSNIPVESKDVERALSAVNWRQIVKKTGKGAFSDMRAIIVSKNNSSGSSIANIIEAGGGSVIESRPPYDNNDYATHCLIDSKMTNDVSDFVELTKRGIYCVPLIYLSNFLINKNLDITKAIVPSLLPYYTK